MDNNSERSILLADDKSIVKDCKLIERAAKEEWSITPERRAAVVDRLIEIIQKTSVMVATKQGPMQLDGPADANAIAASRALVAMVGQNQKASPVAQQHEHHHTHDLGPVTADNLEQHRQLRIDRINKARKN